MNPILLKIIGLAGGFCFAYCGVPTAWATIKKGASTGMPVITAWMISVGGILMYWYLTASFGFDWVLAVNYLVEVVSWLIVVKYHYRPKK